MARHRGAHDGRAAHQREIHQRVSGRGRVVIIRPTTERGPPSIQWRALLRQCPVLRGLALDMTDFEFATATRITFGTGKLRDVGPIAKDFGNRALVVTGKTVDRAQTLRALLRATGVSSVTFPVSGEPTIDVVVRGAQFAKAERCSVVTGFGGGSAIDAGKAIAAMLTNDGDLLD